MNYLRGGEEAVDARRGPPLPVSSVNLQSHLGGHMGSPQHNTGQRGQYNKCRDYVCDHSLAFWPGGRDQYIEKDEMGVFLDVLDLDWPIKKKPSTDHGDRF